MFLFSLLATSKLSWCLEDMQALLNGGSLIDAACISVPEEMLSEARDAAIGIMENKMETIGMIGII